MDTSRISLTLSVLVLGLGGACGGESTSEGDGASIGTTEIALVTEATETTAAWAQATALAQPSDGAAVGDLNEADQAFLRRSPCATRTRQNGQLRVDFGAGCTYRGWTISGALTAAATKTPSQATLSVGFENLSGGGRTLDGSVSVSATRGSGLAASGQLTKQEGTQTVERLFAGTVVGTGDGVELDGTATRVNGTTVVDIEVDAVRLDFGDCYPNAGRLLVEQSAQPTVMVQFSAQTPLTGEVSVQIGQLPPQPATLPACPL